MNLNIFEQCLEELESRDYCVIREELYNDGLKHSRIVDYNLTRSRALNMANTYNTHTPSNVSVSVSVRYHVSKHGEMHKEVQ